MKRTIKEIIDMIDAEINKHRAESGIAQIRNSRLELIKKFLNKNGFPRNIKEKFELSLHLYYFQEVNHDDLDPYKKNGNLGHLKNAYEIDLAVQTKGQTRESISSSDYSRYVKDFSKILDWKLRKSRFWDKILLSISRMRS